MQPVLIPFYPRPSTTPDRSFSPPVFRGGNSKPPTENGEDALAIPRQYEKALQRKELRLRKLANFFRNLLLRPKVNRVHKEVMGLDVNSKEYVQTLIRFLNGSASGLAIEVNTENGEINKLAESDEACIFILNHDPRYQVQDSAMLAMFLMLLYSEYLQQGKAGSCPRPKIILNKDILEAQLPKMREIWEKMGAVGVDASLIPDEAARSENMRIMRPLLDAFAKDRNHIFIFPEGKRIIFDCVPEHKQKPLRTQLAERFQKGVSEIVNLMSRKKARVKVVPLGLSFNSGSQEKIASVHIGKELFFQRVNGVLTCTAGDINEETSPYAPLFKEVDRRPFKEKGKDLVPAIGGILCENLRINRQKAADQLPEKLPADKAEILNPLHPDLLN